MSESSPPQPPGNPMSLSAQVASLTRLVSEQQQKIAAFVTPREAFDDHDGGSHDSQSNQDNNFDEMLKSLDEKNDASLLKNEIEEALADVEETNDFGPDIQQGIATAFNKTVMRPLSKETKGTLKKRVLIPANCKIMMPPKVNQEIWSMLPTKSRLIDLNYHQVQTTLATGVATLAIMSDEIAKLSAGLPKETMHQLLKAAMDTANLLGTQMQDLNQKRKQAIKPYITADYAGICSMDVPPGDFLFGNNLSESLKSSKATSSMIRQTSGARSRYRPYGTPPRSTGSTSLNWSAPFQPRARWNGSQDRRRQQPRSFNQFQYPRQNLLGKPQFNKRN